ncbi:hypothetical protein ACFL6G_04100 [candidate division KSB1 bacterium]
MKSKIERKELLNKAKDLQITLLKVFPSYDNLMLQRKFIRIEARARGLTKYNLEDEEIALNDFILKQGVAPKRAYVLMRLANLSPDVHYAYLNKKLSLKRALETHLDIKKRRFHPELIAIKAKILEVIKELYDE